MRFIAVLLFLTASFAFVSGQEPDASATPPEQPPAAEVPADRAEFRSAAGTADPAERERAMAAFVENFPESELLRQAREIISVARAEQAAKAVEEGRKEDAFRLFKAAVSEAPEPVSEELFAGVFVQIPGNLFFRGFRSEAYEIARAIEEKVGADAKKVLGVASFYLAVEDASESRRLAERALELDPELPAGYQTLGLAHRLGFNLEASETAYSKALELDPSSTVSKRSLAEIKRATGKAEEAVRLYDEIIAANPADAGAGTGRTLALFDAGRLSEAEPALELQLQVNPKNLVLLVGAAYWYAANGNPEKAVDYASKALAAEPRYTWGYIALARGLVASGKPLEAEKTLLAAKRYGNFPTLDYELAAARLSAGFFRDAADALESSFSIADGELKTRLGGRVERSSDNFLDLLAAERKAGIFQPVSADDPESAAHLKRLLRFRTVLEAGSGPEVSAEAADSFVNGPDRMRTHRQIFAAGRLLEKKVALEKVTELSRAAAGGVDDSLLTAVPSAAVLADELYESRKLAIARDTLIVVPDIPRQTLAKILRGRIEELDGSAAYELGDKEDALLHFKRALSIVPADSAWSRSVHWKMGTALESLGRESEALDSYITSYRSGGVTEGRKIVIETLYKKIYGSLDGLEARLSGESKPQTTTASLLLKPSEPAEEKETSPDPAVQEPAETRDVPEEVTENELPKQTGVAGDSPSPVPTATSGSVDENSLEDIAEATGQAMNNLDLDKPIVTAERSNEEAEEESGETTSDPVGSGSADEAVRPKSETNSAEGQETQGAVPAGTRPRIVPGTRERVSTPANSDSTECRIVLSQETAAITVGGSTGILAGVEGSKGVFSLKGVSSSPDDLKVTVDRSFAEIVGRAMFLVTSVSSNTGVYTVTFQTTCGTKDLLVTVR